MALEYLNIALKMLAAFLVVVGYIHLSGKGSLAPISALDQVGNFVFGALTGGAIYNPSISVLLLVAVSTLWAAMLLFVRFLSFRRGQVKNMVDGRSIPLMRDGVVLSENFGHAKLTVRDFIMLLHQRGYNNLSGLKNVWFEYNGQLTVVKKGEPEMALVLMEGGQAEEENLKSFGRDKDWLLGEISRQGSKPEDVFLAEWHDGKLWLYPYSEDDPQRPGAEEAGKP